MHLAETKNLPTTKEDTLAMIKIVELTLLLDEDALAEAIEEGDSGTIREELREVADSKRSLAELKSHVLTFE